MFQFRRFPTYDYLIHHRLTDSSSAGFPHSEIHGSKPAFGSPWLIADRCVLRRLLVPRHSPCALCSLTIFFLVLWVLSSTNNICSFLPFKYYLSLFFVQFSRCIFASQKSFSLREKQFFEAGLELPTFFGLYEILFTKFHVAFKSFVFSLKLGFSSERRVFQYASEKKSSISRKLVGSSGLEPPTSRLSGVRSNHLSYEPV